MNDEMNDAAMPNDELRDVYGSDDVTSGDATLMTDQITDYLQPEANSKTPENKIRNLSVKQLNYGYVVKVGCHEFAIESSDKVSELIAEYLADPNETEKKWFNKELSIKSSF